MGHEISEHGIATNPHKVEAIRHWSVPSSLKDVQKFMGFVSYYRRFFNNFSTITRPITSLTQVGIKFRVRSDIVGAW